MDTPLPLSAGDAHGQIRSWRRQDDALWITHSQGHTRIEVCAPDIFRIRFAPQEGFAARRSWAVPLEQTGLDLGPVRVSETPGAVILGTSACEVRLDVMAGTLRFCHRCGHAFAEDAAAPRWQLLGAETPRLPPGAVAQGPGQIAVTLDKHMLGDEGYYGFGERTGKLNRRFRRLVNWTTDVLTPGQSRVNNNLYQAHPSFVAVRPGFAWGLFLNSTWYSEFDVGAEREDILRLWTLGGELDYYLFTGPTPAAVVEQLTRLTGRPLLPPLWAFGFHQSRWSYASAGEVEGVAQGFRARRIPLDAIHLDIDYMNGFRVFTWDPQRFAEPRRMIGKLQEQGTRTVTIVDPGVKKDLGSGYAVADEGSTRDAFIKNPDGTWFSAYCWPGEALFPDFTRREVRSWWSALHRGLVEAGVAGIWNDMNEPALFDRPFGRDALQLVEIPAEAPQGDGHERTSHAEVHNLYGLLMARATAEGLGRLGPGRRPWLLTRSAYTGIQRYAVSWMGDNSSWWEHLEMSLPQLASMGLCGNPHVGADVGGFYENCHGELYARWIELGAFYPFMRAHTALGTRPQEPWSFGPEIEAIARQSIELRYRLLPYFYTLAYLAHRTGAPMLRPLFYDFPEQADCQAIEDQIMVGPLLMVAPVCHPGLRRRLVELPGGPWYDFWTGRRLTQESIIQTAPLGRPPVLVRGGALLCLGNVRQSTREPLAELTVAVYPAGAGRWTLIEDDGESTDYLDGAVAETTFESEERAEEVLVRIDSRQGPYRPPPRKLRVQVHLPGMPAAVLVDGVETGDWEWDAATHAARVSWEDDGLSHEVLTVHRLPAALA
jgi:alpha-glucosidase